MSDAPQGAERRKHRRVPKKIMLKFRGVAPAAAIDRADLVGIMVEVSRGGLTLRSPRPYAPGAIVELQLPETELGPARRLHLKVAWQKRVENSTQFDVGGGFVKYVPQTASATSAEPAGGGTRRYKTAALKATGNTMRRAKEGADKRQHTRYLQKVYVKYRCVSKGMFHETDDRVGVLLDFSRGGFVFAGVREYTVGSIIEIKFPETPLGPASTLHAKVVRTSPHDRPAQHRVACSFVQES